MIVMLAFWLLLLGALSTGWQAGDRYDRRMIFAVGIAAALTAMSDLFLDDRLSLVCVGIVDLALLAIVTRYALVSQKHWPIWFAGIHATSVVLGIGALFLPADQQLVPDLASAFWAIPALAAMVLGLLIDQRYGITNETRR